MDGVLIEAKEWHYRALNIALRHFGEEISRDEHESRFDGLPTRVKLEMLSEERGFPRSLHKVVSKIKQIETLRLAAENSKVNMQHIRLLEKLRKRGLKLGVATNSIRLTTEVFLELAGVRDYFEVVTTNEDVVKSKPSPDVYSTTCQKLSVKPNFALAIEDSTYGVISASDAGCHVMKVNSPSELTVKIFDERLKTTHHD